MKVCWMGFLASNHSWSIVAQNISRELIKQGHEVDLFSTNGSTHFPEDLKQNLKGFVEEGSKFTPSLIKELSNDYDMQLSYTILPNFANYFSRGSSNRFGIWNYETTILPENFAKNYRYVDLMFPSSNFSKQIFIENGIPDNKQVVIPHGINLNVFENKDKYPLKTKKKYKVLANIAQLHARKNLYGLLSAYGKAFTNKDDVCLVLKISRVAKKSNSGSSSIDFDIVLQDFKSRYKNHGEIEIIDKFIPSIETLYNACDILFTMTHTECFYMPGLEAMAANKIVIAPRYGGQLDYMNDDNSILVDGKVIRADKNLQYYSASVNAKAFDPSVDDAVSKLKDVVNNYDSYSSRFSKAMSDTANEFTWENAVNKILKQAKQSINV